MNSGQPPVYRSERYYYDGQRRIAEVVVDPVASIAAAIASEDEELLGIASIPGAIVGDTPDGKKKAVPLWFEGLQQSELTEPPPAYISREYIWGPGDRGPDELLAMFAWDGVGGTGNVNNGTARPPNTLWSVITDASGDCVGLITEATLSQDAQVAWQATYEPYGTLIDSRSIVPHPHLKAGHKGLFAERLDGGVVTGMLGVDRGRLEPGATLLYHNRNRTFSPTLGRFLQSDPNASGLAVIGSVSYSGMRAAVDVMGADLSAMTGDGVGLYQYLGGNPIRESDPTGLFSIIDLLTGGGEALDIYSDYNDQVVDTGASVAAFIENTIQGAARDQESDLDWALDWSRRDDEYSQHSRPAILDQAMGAASPASYDGPVVASIFKGAGKAAKRLGSKLGKWERAAESMSERAAAYQAKFGRRGYVYRLNGVKFDGMKGKNLIDAKGPGYERFVSKKTGDFYTWFRGGDAIVDQAERQLRAASGTGMTVVWNVAERRAMDVMRRILDANKCHAIQLRHVPP